MICLLVALTLLLRPSNTADVTPTCTEMFPGCATCSSDFSQCSDCEIGFYLLNLSKPLFITAPATGQKSTICLPDCEVFQTHTNSLPTRECISTCSDPACQVCGSDGVCLDNATIAQSPCDMYSFQLPSGECSAFACPPGYYRQASTKQCLACDDSCAECGGPLTSDCQSCNSGYALQYHGQNKGSCQLQTAINTPPQFQIFVDHDQALLTSGTDPLPHQQRDGSPQLPFLDLRDALLRADELASPYSAASVTVFLTKGTHFITKEDHSFRYKPSMTTHFASNYSLSIQQVPYQNRPLPCSYMASSSSFVFNFSQVCTQEDESVSIRVKIGAFFSITVPASLSISHLQFDFSDSLLLWNSTCSQKRAPSCQVTVDSQTYQLSVQSLLPECSCSHPLRYADSCFFHHPLSLFNTYSPTSPTEPKTLSLNNIVLTHLYSFYNSVIGFNSSSQALSLEISHSSFSNISMCGSLLSSHYSLPQDSAHFYSSIQHAFASGRASVSALESRFSLSHSLFSHWGLALSFQRDASPLLYATAFPSYNYSSFAPFLNLHSFQGELSITHSTYQHSPLFLNFSLPSISSLSASTLDRSLSPVAVKREGYLRYSLISLSNHSKGVSLFNNSFSHLSSLAGVVSLELSSSFQKGVFLANNSFSSSSALLSPVALNLLASYSSSHPYSCSGFYLQNNTFHHLLALSGTSLISLECLDEEGNYAPSVDQPAPLLLTHQLGDGLSVQVDYSQVALINTTISANFRAPDSSSLLLIASVSSLNIEGLFLYMNGDLSSAQSLTEPLLFWKQYSGMHLFYIDDSLLSLSSSSLLSTQSALLLINGPQSLTLTNLKAVQNIFSYSLSESGPLLLTSDAASLSLNNSLIDSPLSTPSHSFLQYILSLEENFNTPSPLLQSHSSTSLLKSHLIEAGGNLALLSSTIRAVKSSSSFGLIPSQSQVHISSCFITDLELLQFISASSLAILQITGSHFSNFTLALAFPHLNLLTIADSSFNNEDMLILSIPTSFCSLASSLTSGIITRSSFYYLNGNSSVSCSQGLISNGNNVQLQISDSFFRFINIDLPNYFLELQGTSTLIVNRTEFHGFSGRVIYVSGTSSILKANEVVFSQNREKLIKITESSFFLDYSTIIQNSFRANSNGMIQVELTTALFRISHSFFSQNAGRTLIYLWTIKNENTLGVGEPDIAGLGRPSNLHEVTFLGNLIDEILHTQSCDGLIITNLYYQGNLRETALSHSSFSFVFTELRIRYAHFNQTGTFLDSNCSSEMAWDQSNHFFGVYNIDRELYLMDSYFSDICVNSHQRFFQLASALAIVGFHSVSFQNIKGASPPNVVFTIAGSAILHVLNCDFRHIKASLFVNQVGGIVLQYSTFQYLQFPVVQTLFITQLTGNTFQNCFLGTNTFYSSKRDVGFIINQNVFRNIETGRMIEIHFDGQMSQEQESGTIMQNVFQNITITGEEGGALSFSSLDHIPLTIEQNAFTSITITSSYGVGVLSFKNFFSNQITIVSFNQFQDCEAAVAGGIHWDALQPTLLENTFTNVNASIYGDILASYPAYITFIDESLYLENQIKKPTSSAAVRLETKLLEQRSGDEMPVLYLAAIDSLGQIVRTVSSEQAQFSLFENLEAEQTQSNYTHFFSVRSNHQWDRGIFKLDNITLVGEPGRDYQFTLDVTQILDLNKPDTQTAVQTYGTVKSLITIDFRLCEAGEAFLKTGECQICPQHTYLFEAYNEPTDCLLCPRNALCFGGDKIGPVPGLWREDSKSLQFLSCFNPAACLGSFNGEDPNQEYDAKGSCADNYEGALCSQCKPDYSRNAQYECSPCPPLMRNLLITIGFCLLAVFVFFVLILLTLRSMTRPRSLFSAHFRLILNHFQFLMLLASFRFDWPSEVKTFLSLFDSVADAPQQLFSLDCLFEHFSPLSRFYSFLMLYALYPLFGILFLALFWRLCSRLTARPFCSRFIASSLIFIFLVHPAVTRVLFSLLKQAPLTLSCYELGGKWLLLEELSSECWAVGSQHYYFVLAVGVPGMAVWVVGIPLFTFLVLYQNSSLLRNTRVKKKYGFLYNGFHARSYYWEVISIVRKEVVAAISVFLVQQGTVVQSMLLLLAMVFFVLLTIRIAPYERPQLNRLELQSLLALSLTAFVGLFYLASKQTTSEFYEYGKDFSLSESQRWVLLLVIVLANCWVLLQIVWSIVGVSRSSMRETCPRFYGCCCLCLDRRLLKEQNESYKATQQNLRVIIEINEVIAKLTDLRKKYEKNAHFSGKKKFQELLLYVSQTLRKVSSMNDTSVISTRHQTNSTHLLAQKKRAEMPLEVDFEEIKFDYDLSFDQLKSRVKQ